MNDQDKLNELENELCGLKAEYMKLRERENELEIALRETKERMQELSGSVFNRYGLVHAVKDKIKRLRRVIDDKQKRRIVWTDGTTSQDQILDKVTPKRIFVRTIGCEKSDQYIRSTGERVSSWSGCKKIDLEAMGISPD